MRNVTRLSISTALLGAFLLLGHAAQGQQTILQSGPWTNGHAPVYAGSSSNNPVVIDSGVSPGQVALGTAGQIPWYATTGSVLTGNANSTISGGALRLGVTGSAQGSVLLSGSASGTVSLVPQAAAGTFNFNFPITAGTAGGPLLSGGGGTSPMAWGTLSGNTTKFATASGAFVANNCATFDASGNIVDSGGACPGTGAPLSPAAGGTGVSNLSGSTITLGGSLTFSGAHTTAFTVSNNTSVTLPTTGTLATLAGAETLTNKTITTFGGAFTFNPANASATLSPTGSGTVTINPATSGTMDNVAIGATTPSPGIFTTLGLKGSGSGLVTVQPQAAAGTYNFNLPTTAGTPGQPLISGGGISTPMSFGTLSGNTTEFATVSGALTNTHCVRVDASGNLTDSGSVCASGSGTVDSGTAGQIPYYATSTNEVGGNANLTISSGALSVGVTGAAAGSVILGGSSTGAITIKGSGSAIGTYNYNLPTTAGTAGGPLLSGGGGASAMTFGTISGNTTKFATAIGSYTPGNCVSADANGNLVDNGTPCGSGGSGTVVSSTAGQLGYYPTSTNTIAGNSSVTISSGALTLGVPTTAQGQVKLSGATSGTITITGQAAAGTYEFDMPITAGTAGQYLTSQGGAGTPMTWSTVSAVYPAWGGVKTTNFNAVAGTAYCVDTKTTGVVTMTMPASPTDGDQIRFIDCKHNFATTAMTVARNGNNLMGVAQDMTVNTTNASGTFVWSSGASDWVMY